MSMRILVICDDYWHPGDVVKAGLEPLKDHGMEFIYTEDMSDFELSGMTGYPVVILSKSNNISSSSTKEWATEEAQKFFDRYVSKGGGLLAIHSGTADYRDAGILRNILGGVFTHHPEQCPVMVEAKGEHAVTRGFTPFNIKDEHYFMEIDNADKIHVFLTAASQHGIQPAGWTRYHGAGRVCVLTPGHNLDVWLHESYQVLLKNAVNWCAGRA
ncbi:MAG: ThuA domain-containing protein [Clostridiales bacterium]|nr:ThuA domain-containing protein [Clostridiales bacterium]